MDTISKIFNLMKSKKIPQNDFARIIGVKPQSVTDWKAGRVKSYRRYAPQIAEYYGVSLDWLSGNTDAKEKPATNGGREIVACVEVELSNKGIDYGKYIGMDYKKHFAEMPKLIVVTDKNYQSCSRYEVWHI